MDKAMQRRHKIRDKSFFFVWMACLLFTLFFYRLFFLSANERGRRHAACRPGIQRGKRKCQRGGAQRGDQRQSAAAGFR